MRPADYSFSPATISGNTRTGKAGLPQSKPLKTAAIPACVAKVLAPLLLLVSMVALAPSVRAADLKPKTVEAFERYVKLTEARIDAELKDKYLYVETLPAPRRTQVLASLRNGEIYMERLTTRDAAGKGIEIPDGLIHHWMGAVFIPCVSLDQTLAFVEDYDRHKDFYKPEVIDSKLRSHNGNDFQIYYRLRKKKIITVTLNTEHDVHYFPLDATHCYSRSYTTRIAEVADADSGHEREKPVGHDGGFLWRLYSYWRFEQRDGGVYVECESVSLTRGVPAVLKPLIGPFITGIPKESLLMTMGSTRSGLTARFPCNAQAQNKPGA
jgi:hypothetical protein